MNESKSGSSTGSVFNVYLSIARPTHAAVNTQEGYLTVHVLATELTDWRVAPLVLIGDFTLATHC